MEDVPSVKAVNPLSEPIDLPLLPSDDASVLRALSVESDLPAPPSSSHDLASVPLSSDGSNKRDLSTALPDAPLSSRNKRPKSVKFSPSKGEHGRARRLVATAASSGARAAMVALGMAVEPEAVANHDWCNACGGKGHFLCCDGCPRSFHFACLEPPLQLDELPSDSWFCKVCMAAKHPRNAATSEAHRGLFGPLIERAEVTNAKVFKLPEAIKGYFQEVTTNSSGDYVDLETYKMSKVNKHGVPEEREPFRIRDKAGDLILCYQCRQPADQATNRKILACDFCDQHWHLDCLNPPMTALPPTGRRWQCPLHAQAAAPRQRQPKNQKVLVQNERHMPNNGLIDVVPRNKGKAKAVPDYDESIVNGVRYQVPEETIILDFWDKIRGVTMFKRPVKLAKSGRVVKPEDASSDVSSPLSSPPSSPASQVEELVPDPLPRIRAPTDDSEQTDDRMVVDVNGVESPLPEDGRTLSPSSMVDSRYSSPFDPLPRPSLKAMPLEDHSQSLLPPEHDGMEGLDHHHHVGDLSAPPLSVDGRRGPPSDAAIVRPGTPSTAGSPLKVKLALPAHPPNVAKRAARSRDVSPAPRITRSRTSSPQPPVPMAASTSAQKLPDPATTITLAPPPVDRRRALGNGTTTTTTIPAAPHPSSQLRQSVTAKPDAPPRRPASMSPSLAMNAPKTMSDGQGSATAAPMPPPTPPQPRRHPSSTSKSASPSTTLPELALRSKEDLRALAHVRKMLRGETYNGQKETLLDFLGAESPPVPKMPFMDSASSQPWELPWENAS